MLFAIPFLQTYLAPIFWFAGKAGFLLFIYIWVRGTLPRFRYDQLMHFAWTFLFPCALLNLMVTAFCVAVFRIAWTRSYLSSSRLSPSVAALTWSCRNIPISSALSLIGVMGSLAVLYLLLGAEFIAMAQMIVYGGAVMVLFIFVIMLLNAGTEKASGKSWFAQIAGFPLLCAFVALLAFLIRVVLPPLHPVEFGSWVGGTAEAIGMLLFTKYLLPFEVTSVLILIAIIGAVVLARKEID